MMRTCLEISENNTDGTELPKAFAKDQSAPEMLCIVICKKSDCIDICSDLSTCIVYYIFQILPSLFVFSVSRLNWLQCRVNAQHSNASNLPKGRVGDKYA